jgi:hypothetical protein
MKAINRLWKVSSIIIEGCCKEGINIYEKFAAKKETGWTR